MGSVFALIADDALHPCGGDTCHCCERTAAPVYDYSGKIIDPSRAANPELARSNPDVEELCAECILGNNISKCEYRVGEILPMLRVHTREVDRALDEFRHSPDLCFIQNTVWPICCGLLTEYIGDHPTPGTDFDDYRNWQPQDARMEKFRLADFYPLEKLPVLYSMNLFCCRTCPQRYWVFQYSGLLWPGPTSDTQPG